MCPTQAKHSRCNGTVQLIFFAGQAICAAIFHDQMFTILCLLSNFYSHLNLTSFLLSTVPLIMKYSCAYCLTCKEYELHSAITPAELCLSWAHNSRNLYIHFHKNFDIKFWNSRVFYMKISQQQLFEDEIKNCKLKNKDNYP